jgi:hypothetical protein
VNQLGLRSSISVLARSTQSTIVNVAWQPAAFSTWVMAVRRGEHDARTGVVALPVQLEQCAHAHDGEEPHAGKIDDHVTVGKRTQVITKLGDGRETDFTVDRDDHPVGGQADADVDQPPPHHLDRARPSTAARSR